MRRMDSDGQRVLNLRAVFALNFLWLRVFSNVLGERPERTNWIQKGRNLVLGLNRTPAERFPLARQREMQAEVGVRMSFCIVRNFREPGPRNDDARRRDVTSIERFQTRCVFG